MQKPLPDSNQPGASNDCPSNPQTAVAVAVTVADPKPCPVPWRSLGTPPRELRLEFTLPTGQSFRWRQTGPGEFTGVIGSLVVRMRQAEQDVQYVVLGRVVPQQAGPGHDGKKSDPHSGCKSDHNSWEEEDALVRDYFNLSPSGTISSNSCPGARGSSLTLLAEQWAAADKRFAAISPYFPGARMLRQPPLECLFQFICSSNNHISRIAGMVERLCSSYGTALTLDPAILAALQQGQQQGQQQGPHRSQGLPSLALVQLMVALLPPLVGWAIWKKPRRESAPLHALLR